jgi:integrase
MRRRYPDLHRRGEYYYFFRRDEKGKRHEESLRTTDVLIAKQRHQIRTREIESGRSPNDLRAWSLQKAIAFWLEHRQLRVSQGTFKAESSIARNLLRIFGGDVTLGALADIRRVREYQDVRLKEGISPKTANNEVQELASVLKLAELWQRVEHHYKPLRVVKSDLPVVLTQEESTRLLAVAATCDPLAVAPHTAVLAFDTGMRVAEIRGLRLGDLHHTEDRPFLCIRRAETKSDAGVRRVVLGAIALWALDRLVERAHLLGCNSPEDCLLPTDRSRHTRENDPLHGASGYDLRHPMSSWESEWQKFRRAVGITHHRFHNLRHTYISRAAEAGVPVAIIQVQVGHLSVEMTRWYVHISEQAQFKAVRRMENQNPELLQCLGLRRRDSISAQGSAGVDRQPAKAPGSTLQ